MGQTTQALTSPIRLIVGQHIAYERAWRGITVKQAVMGTKLTPAVWSAIEAGQTVKWFYLRQAIKKMWPSTKGHWMSIPDLPQALAPSSPASNLTILAG